MIGVVSLATKGMNLGLYRKPPSIGVRNFIRIGLNDYLPLINTDSTKIVLLAKESAVV